MAYQHITLARDGVRATLTLNRPELHNAFSPELIAELTAACAELAADATVRVVVLTGAGRSFCAGADLHWMRASLALSRDDNIADAERLAAMYEALDTLPKPVVGRVNGAAIGGGAGLVACCDIVIAAQSARFGFSEVKLGILPAVIARYVVPKIGVSQARALFITGQRFEAAQAQRIGLVHEVVPEAELDAAVARVVAELASSGPQAVARIKHLLRAVTSLPPDAATRATVEAIADARVSDEGQEGLRAFLEKRRPAWSV